MFSFIIFIILIIVFLLLLFFKKFRELFFRKYPEDNVISLTEEEFYAQFENSPLSQHTDYGIEMWKELLTKAWDTRNFEIELYWKRANYFWLFQVPAFSAYFVLNKDNNLNSTPDEIFVIICLGMLFSTAWFLINKGSKAWQRHWEIYTDLLEIKYFGPLYRTVNHTNTFSVSKINEIVSFAFIGTWLLFSINFLYHKLLFINFHCMIYNFNLLIACSIFFTVLGLTSMMLGYGRGFFKRRDVQMFARIVEYKK